MTPFDPAALVAMLRAFYPVVSSAEFARARRDRGEYFAAGVIFGSKGDKLRLPDGREFDCILAAGGPPAGRSWMCSPILPGDDAGDDPFALEDGPLVYLDEAVTLFPGGDPTFESLVAGPLGEIARAEPALDDAAQTVITADPAGALDDTYRARVEPAAARHAEIRRALDNDNPIDVANRTNDQTGEIDAAREDYVEEPPPDDPEPDPGDPPGGDDRKEPPEK